MSAGCINEALPCLGEGFLDQFIGWLHFDQLALFQNHDDLAEVAHNSEVMPDKNEGKAILRLEARQQLENLSLGGDVQGTDGLITDEEVRLAEKGSSNADPLLLASRELMRVSISGI